MTIPRRLWRWSQDLLTPGKYLYLATTPDGFTFRCRGRVREDVTSFRRLMARRGLQTRLVKCFRGETLTVR